MSIKLNKIQLNSIYYENETIVDGETWEYVRHDEGIKGVT